MEAHLIIEPSAIQPGQTFRVGVLFLIEPHWHTYWRNGGDAGLATDIRWELPEGFRVGALQWPVPMPLTVGGVTSYGYEEWVLHWAEVTAPEVLAGPEVRLGAQVSWLECKEACIPGEARLERTVRVISGEAAEAGLSGKLSGLSEDASWFSRNDARMPAENRQWRATFRREGGGVILRLEALDRRAELPSRAMFFPYEAWFKAVEEQKWISVEGGWETRLELQGFAPVRFERIEGVLAETATKQPRGIELVAEAVASPAPRDTLPLWILFPLAVLGGLILNLMPCVFPVLGLKVMAFARQGGESPGRVVMHGLVYTAGILVSFWILGGGLLLLRAGGEELGWGFQLQNPVFVLTLALLLFLFGLNMAGVFEVGARLMAMGGGAASGRSGWIGDWIMGALAVVLATPCSAPFLATALGSALVVPPLDSMLLFTGMGLGLALPYLVLSIRPSLAQRLPRPGPWMESFKQGMSFLLFAAAAFLIWVLAGQLEDEALLWILLSLTSAAVAVWIHGRWTQRGVGGWKARVATVVAGVATLMMAWAGLKPPAHDWLVWSPAELERHRAAGRVIYVDFTARWCVTCQANKLAVFSSPEVRRRFAELGVIKLQADWTARDPQITQELARWGRAAVPFNLIYGPGREEPEILPEILTPGIVLEALERVAP